MAEYYRVKASHIFAGSLVSDNAKEATTAVRALIERYASTPADAVFALARSKDDKTIWHYEFHEEGGRKGYLSEIITKVEESSDGRITLIPENGAPIRVSMTSSGQLSSVILTKEMAEEGYEGEVPYLSAKDKLTTYMDQAKGIRAAGYMTLAAGAIVLALGAGAYGLSIWSHKVVPNALVDLPASLKQRLFINPRVYKQIESPVAAAARLSKNAKGNILALRYEGGQWRVDTNQDGGSK